MGVLLLGYSSIARRRVLPALAALGIGSVDVASRSAADSVELPAPLSGRVFDDYRTALDRSEADRVYVSTTNDLHAALATAALESGRHVAIDKPAATSLADVRRLVDLACAADLVVAEATVYSHHPMIEAARRVFDEAGSRPTRIVGQFCFPPLPEGNYRYRAAAGGGAVLDLGPYAVTPGRLFFGALPDEIVCRRFGQPGVEVETSFSLLATYPGNRSFVGHYGMTTGYVNRLELAGPDATVVLDRVFTAPADLAARLAVAVRNERRTVDLPPADSFALFLSAVDRAIESGQGAPLADAMLADATLLDQLQNAG